MPVRVFLEQVDTIRDKCRQAELQIISYVEIFLSDFVHDYNPDCAGLEMDGGITIFSPGLTQVNL